MSIVPAARVRRPAPLLSLLLSLLVLLVALLAPLEPARAQRDDRRGGPPDSAMAGHAMDDMAGMGGHAMDEHAMAEHAMADGAMSGAMLDMSAHMRMTKPRPATDADRQRAAALVPTLRASLAKYRDVRAAEADGYVMFAPGVKRQHVYHFTKKWSAVKAAFTFDPAAPTSLLYRKDASGNFFLVGAMYTAPKGASEDELNARVPLSVARWHQHVDICIPKRGDRDRWREMDGGRMRFGPAGTITTRAACDAAGGRFFPQLFGWMVHANVFAGDEPGVIWGN